MCEKRCQTIGGLIDLVDKVVSGELENGFAIIRYHVSPGGRIPIPLILMNSFHFCNPDRQDIMQKVAKLWDSVCIITLQLLHRYGDLLLLQHLSINADHNFIN